MMKNTTTEHSRGWKHRAMSALGALMIAGSALALTAAATSAEMSCNYPYGSNTCLTLEDQGWGICKIRVGIDVYMSQQYAQYLFDMNGGFPFGVEILAHDHDDPADDTAALGVVDAIYEVSPGSNGLFGNFEIDVGCAELNEDTDGRDEIVARVTLYDPNYGPVQFHSGIIVGYW